MTIRELFSKCTNRVLHLTVIHSDAPALELFVDFDNLEDKDFENFDSVADTIIHDWFIGWDGHFFIQI